MNILVTGANGQLGNEMRIVSVGSPHKFIFTDFAELDITDGDAVDKTIREKEVNIVVNCAAYTNVDKAEDEPELAERLNAKAVENIARAIKRNDGLLIHISTDYVFGGTSRNVPYGEEEPGNPVGVYGITKLHGEEAAIASGGKYVIIRTAWLYSEFGKNFLKTMLNLTSTREQVKVVFDQVGTPTYAYDLANAIMAVIEDYYKSGYSGSYKKRGIYHFSNEGVCSWFDFTKMIAEYAGNTGCDIQPCHSSEFPSKVTRPSYSVLDKTKIKKCFGVAVPYWTESLRRCMEKMKEIS